MHLIGIRASDANNLTSYSKLDLGPVVLDSGSTSYSQGVNLSAPASDHTFGAWTEMSQAGVYATPNNVLNGDSLSFQYDMLGVVMSGNYFASTNVDLNFIVEMGYGSAGNETVFSRHFISLGNANTTSQLINSSFWMPWGRPAGDRISMRYQTNNVSINGGLRAFLMGLR